MHQTEHRPKAPTPEYTRHRQLPHYILNQTPSVPLPAPVAANNPTKITFQAAKSWRGIQSNSSRAETMLPPPATALTTAVLITKFGSFTLLYTLSTIPRPHKRPYPQIQPGLRMLVGPKTAPHHGSMDDRSSIASSFGAGTHREGEGVAVWGQPSRVEDPGVVKEKFFWAWAGGVGSDQGVEGQNSQAPAPVEDSVE